MNDKDEKLIEGGNENKSSINKAENKARQEFICVSMILTATLVFIFAASYFESKNEKDEFYYHEPDSFAESSLEFTIDSSVADTDSIEINYPVDINIANQDELCGVSGIGDSTANLILEYRNKVGKITDIDELAEISGIGEKTIGLLKEYFFVSDEYFKKYQPTESSSEYDDSIPEQTTVKETKPTSTFLDNATDIYYEPEPQEEEITQRTVVHINSASAEELESALLISYEQACEIVELRNTILYFSAIDELEYVESLTLDEINSFKDYVIID